MTMPVIDAVRAELAQHDSDDLIVSLRLFVQRERVGPLPEHERLVRALIAGELEVRFPIVSWPLERWVTDDADHRSHAEVLLAALDERYPC